MHGRQVAPTQSIGFFRQYDDGATFRRFVCQRGKLRGIGELVPANARGRQKFRGLSIAEGDRSSLIQEKCVHITGSFHCAARHGQYIVLHQAIHAGDANCGKKAANSGGNQANQQRYQHENSLRRVRVDRDGLQCNDSQQENDGKSGQQDVQRNFIWGLLPLGAFNQSNHLVDESFAGVRCDTNFDLIGQYPRAPRDGRAIAARFANDRSGLSGDGRLIDRCDAIDDISVTWNHFARGHNNNIAGAEFGAWNLLNDTPFIETVRHSLGFGAAQSIRLGFAASLRHRFCKVCKQHGEP